MGSPSRTECLCDDNAADFAVGAPSPERAPAAVSRSPPPVGTPARIHDVQGTTRVSPLVGQVVTVPGVVTAVRTFGSARGFCIQDTAPDADPATSEGLFAFTGSAPPPVAPGDAVTVTGTVSGFRPGGTGSANQSTTQLTGPTAVVASSGNPLPAAEVLTDPTVPDPYTPEATAAASSRSRSIPPATRSTSTSPARACAWDWWTTSTGCCHQ